MSYSTKDAIELAMDGNIQEFRNAVNDLLMDKVQQQIQLKKIEVASTFMSSEMVEEEVEIEEDTLAEDFKGEHEKHYDNHEDAIADLERKAEDSARRGDKSGASNAKALIRYHEKARDSHGKALDHHDTPGEREKALAHSSNAMRLSQKATAKHKEFQDKNMID
jgi:Na+-translocating ferredoxin:NAD+ oxidoreductase RnfG subunit